MLNHSTHSSDSMQVSVRNTNFCEITRKFIIAALKVLKPYQDTFVFQSPFGSLALSNLASVMVLKYEATLKQLPEYGAFITFLQSDYNLSKYLGKTVYTLNMSITIRGDDIAQFLLSKYIQNNNSLDYGEHVFMEIYNTLEDFFYTDTMRVRLRAILHTFSSEQEIKLDDNLTIRPLTENEKHYLVGSSTLFDIAPRTQLGFASFVIEYVFDVKKALNAPASRYDYQEGDVLNQILATFRLIKPEKLGVLLVLFDTFNLTPYFGESFSYTYERFRGTDYRVSKDDITEIKNMWNIVKSLDRRKFSFFKTAIGRFNFAYGRNKDEDRLIDLMIALESLFFKEEERSELGYRISLRTAVFLENEPADRNTIYKTMREAYYLRSRIVHGSNVDLIKPLTIDGKSLPIHEVVNTIETYVRKSIRLFLLRLKDKSHEEIIKEIDDAILYKNWDKIFK